MAQDEEKRHGGSENSTWHGCNTHTTHKLTHILHDCSNTHNSSQNKHITSSCTTVHTLTTHISHDGLNTHSATRRFAPLNRLRGPSLMMLFGGPTSHPKLFSRSASRGPANKLAVSLRCRKQHRKAGINRVWGGWLDRDVDNAVLVAVCTIHAVCRAHQRGSSLGAMPSWPANTGLLGMCTIFGRNTIYDQCAS